MKMLRDEQREWVKVREVLLTTMFTFTTYASWPHTLIGPSQVSLLVSKKFFDVLSKAKFC